MSDMSTADLLCGVACVNGKQWGRTASCIHEFAPVEALLQALSSSKHVFVEFPEGLRS